MIATLLPLVSSLLFAHGALPVPPPPGPSAWRRLGATVTSRPERPLRFFRIATPNPNSLAVVATSSSSRQIRLHWYSYCEFQSDDEEFQEHQMTVSGIHTVTAYPPVFDGATLCYISVYTIASPAVVSAAVFGT